MTHTPGPWIADDFCMQDGRRVRVGTTDGSEAYYHRTTTICEAWTNADEPDCGDDRVIGVVEAEANARLIAAAPDLLAVCKAYRAACEAQGIKLGSINGDADAAIAKAENRS